MRQYKAILLLLLVTRHLLPAQDAPVNPVLPAPAPEISSRAAVLLDAATGTLLYSKNPYEGIPPASLTKLMTMHLVQNEIEAGRASPDDVIPLDKESWAINQPPRSSLMFLGPGQIATLGDIMLGLAVSSGNPSARKTQTPRGIWRSSG